MKTKLPAFILRASLLSGVVGGFIGILMSWNDGDDLGWSLLRGAVLMLVFGSVIRWWLTSMAKAWIASRMEAFHAKNKTVENHLPARAR